MILVLAGCLPAVQAGTGANWYNATPSFAFPARFGHSSVAFDNGSGEKIWVMGGDDGTFTYPNDVWSSSDGATWGQVLHPALPLGRTGSSSVVFGGRMWLIGGTGDDGSGGTTVWSDTWNSTSGFTWNQATADGGFPARYGHTSVVFDGKMWVIGGYDYGSYYSDVWNSSNGISWDQATADAGFPPRYGHSSVVFDNGTGEKIWVIGGTDDTSVYSDVWYSSDGVDWNKATGNTGFSPRYGHSSVVFDGKIWVIGGNDLGPTAVNDSWYSADGITWNRATNGAGFSARYGQSSVVFDNRMWVIGGDDNSRAFHDSWYSVVPAALAVTSLTPATGTSTGLVSISSLAGNGFVSGTAVNLTHAGQAYVNATNVTVISPGKLTCTFNLNGTPAGQWNVTAANPGGQTATLTSGFTVLAPAPTVSSITPASGYNTGSVSISNIGGTGFLAGAGVKLVNSTAGADITATGVTIDPSGKNISCLFDLTGVPAAKRNVTVTNPDSQSGTLVNGFTVLPRIPSVTSISPDSGYNTGPVDITLGGTNFAAGAIVRLDKTGESTIYASDVVVVSAASITCTFDLSSAAAGDWTLSVVNPGNQNSLLGDNNIFQFVVYMAKNAVSSGGSQTGSSGSSAGTSASNAPAAARNQPAAEPAAPAAAGGETTADLTVDAQGVVTGVTALHSEDSLASLSIPAGIVAKDGAGTPLGSVTISALAASAVPADTTGSAYSFAGRAYDLGPDGATFSPAITLTFTVPPGQGGQEYMVRTRDESTNTWVELPTVYHPESGTVTAEVSHFCCFALFAKTPVSPASTARATVAPAQAAATRPSPPPTAMSIFSGMILWSGNQVLRYPFVAGIVILALGALLFGRSRLRLRRKKQRGRSP